MVRSLTTKGLGEVTIGVSRECPIAKISGVCELLKDNVAPIEKSLFLGRVESSAKELICINVEIFIISVTVYKPGTLIKSGRTVKVVICVVRGIMCDLIFVDTLYFRSVQKVLVTSIH